MNSILNSWENDIDFWTIRSINDHIDHQIHQ